MGNPECRGLGGGGDAPWVELNSIGVHDVDHATTKPEGVLRVVVVGDSYAAAFEVALEEAFWAVMERELSTCAALGDPRVEAINIGQRSYGTVEELLALRRFGFAYDPDWVVLDFFTGNDFRNNSRALKESDRPYFEYVDGSLILDESYAEEPDFRRWAGWPGDLWYGLLQRSRMVRVIRQTQRQIKLWIKEPHRDLSPNAGEPGLDDLVYVPPVEADWHAAWRITEGVIRSMHDEVRANGARFLLMTLSNSIQVDPDAEARKAYAARIGATDLFYPDHSSRPSPPAKECPCSPWRPRCEPRPRITTPASTASRSPGAAGDIGTPPATVWPGNIWPGSYARSWRMCPSWR